MQINITSAILGLMLASALVGGAFGFVATKAFVPAELVEVEAELTDSEELAVDCYEIMGVWFDSSGDSPAEDEAFDAQEERGCWPYEG